LHEFDLGSLGTRTAESMQNRRGWAAAGLRARIVFGPVGHPTSLFRNVVPAVPLRSGARPTPDQPGASDRATSATRWPGGRRRRRGQDRTRAAGRGPTCGKSKGLAAHVLAPWEPSTQAIEPPPAAPRKPREPAGRTGRRRRPRRNPPPGPSSRMRVAPTASAAASSSSQTVSEGA
jgi:hypothetical protein